MIKYACPYCTTIGFADPKILKPVREVFPKTGKLRVVSLQCDECEAAFSPSKQFKKLTRIPNQ